MNRTRGADFIKTRTASKIFLSYFGIVVFFLFINFGVFTFLINRLVNDTNESLAFQLERVQQQLREKYDACRRNSVLVMTNPELEKKRMLVDEINMKKGIEILNDVYNNSLQSDIQEIFMYYGDQGIYSNNGYSRQQTFLTSLDARSQSAAAAILSSANEGVYYYGSNYMLFHYPLWQNIDGTFTSVNYCLNLASYAVELTALLQHGDSYLRIVFPNEWTACFGGKSPGGLSVISEDAMPDQKQLGEWTTLETTSDVLGLNFLVSWNPSEIYADIRNYRMISLLTVAMLIILAAIVSYVSGRWQYNPIRKLAEATASILSPRKTESSEKGNEYDYIRNGLSWMMLENSRLGSEIVELQTIMRHQVACRLFKGIYSRKEDTLAMLRLCDIEMHENYYAVACIVLPGGSFDMPAFLRQIELAFSEALCTDLSTETEKMAGFFIQMPSEDCLCRLRLEIGEKIRLIGRDAGLDVLVGFSQAYESVNMISYACLESTIVIREGDGSCSVRIWEQVARPDQDRILISETKLSEFEKVLAQKNQMKANSLLEEILHDSALQQSGRETQALFIRNYLLHSLTLAIRNDKDGCNQKLLTVVIRINPADAPAFLSEMKAALSWYCRPAVNEVDFQRILDYVHDHYANPDLSLDEVAEFADLSKSYLSRLFQRKTGRRYIDYLTNLRMEAARKLLSDSDTPIRDIARMAGYYDVPGFRKKFKATYGVNASAFRKNESTEEEKLMKTDM